MAYQGEIFLERYGKKLPSDSAIRKCWNLAFRSGRHRCYARGELQPVGFALLSGDRKDCRRSLHVSRPESSQSRGSVGAFIRRAAVGFRVKEWQERRDCSGQLPTSCAHRRLLLVPEEGIKDIESVLTIVAGKVVHCGRMNSPARAACDSGIARLVAGEVFGGYGAPLDVRKARPAAFRWHISQCRVPPRGLRPRGAPAPCRRPSRHHRYSGILRPGL